MTSQKRPVRYEKRALFERLTAAEDTSVALPGYHTIETLKQSIVGEMTHLLNERTGPVWQEEGSFATPYAYGIRDIFFSRPYDTEFWEGTAAPYLQNLITRYEPRLRNVRVHVDENMSTEGNLTVQISGEIVLQNVYHPVFFPIAIRTYP
jgi:type VI secretion system lysozyme-like protein